MIVIGTDTHKQSHTAGAVDATGREFADLTVRAKRRSFDDLLVWARGLDGERDVIDAVQIARAALPEGLDSLPAAQLPRAPRRRAGLR